MKPYLAQASGDCEVQDHGPSVHHFSWLKQTLVLGRMTALPFQSHRPVLCEL